MFGKGTHLYVIIWIRIWISIWKAIEERRGEQAVWDACSCQLQGIIHWALSTICCFSCGCQCQRHCQKIVTQLTLYYMSKSSIARSIDRTIDWSTERVGGGCWLLYLSGCANISWISPLQRGIYGRTNKLTFRAGFSLPTKWPRRYLSRLFAALALKSTGHAHTAMVQNCRAVLMCPLLIRSVTDSLIIWLCI